MLTERLTTLPPTFNHGRFMDDLTNLRRSCPECSGMGWTPVEGCAAECRRCDGSGRLPHGPTPCVAASCPLPECRENRATSLQLMRCAE